jgi:hypothetical protein
MLLCADRVAMRPPLSKKERKAERWCWRTARKPVSDDLSLAESSLSAVLEPLGLLDAVVCSSSSNVES